MRARSLHIFQLIINVMANLRSLDDWGVSIFLLVGEVSGVDERKICCFREWVGAEAEE